ncbi:hypothetical protein D8L93_09845 [Sodalis-like symbiont of Bactericera trigonica]|nr:hypothetical protein D8L93_09845 [Sodalis-like symbiont of Bactericera trigonica]
MDSGALDNGAVDDDVAIKHEISARHIKQNYIVDWQIKAMMVAKWPRMIENHALGKIVVVKKTVFAQGRETLAFIQDINLLQHFAAA